MATYPLTSSRNSAPSRPKVEAEVKPLCFHDKAMSLTLPEVSIFNPSSSTSYQVELRAVGALDGDEGDGADLFSETLGGIFAERLALGFRQMHEEKRERA